MATVLSISAFVMGLCLIDVNTLSTDEFAELFTGAPQRGHVPVIMRLERSSITEKTKKIWIEKADCVGWTSFVEGRIDDLMVVGDDPVFLWNEFKNLLHEASLGHIPLKCVSNHSKPFWNSDLTKQKSRWSRQIQVCTQPGPDHAYAAGSNSPMSFAESRSRICCTKLPLVIYPSNVFQIIANRFGTQI